MTSPAAKDVTTRMTEDERNIMNRLHAEGERRSNDFGHRTIVDTMACQCPLQYTAPGMTLSKKGRQSPHPRRKLRNRWAGIEAMNRSERPITHDTSMSATMTSTGPPAPLAA